MGALVEVMRHIEAIRGQLDDLEKLVGDSAATINVARTETPVGWQMFEVGARVAYKWEDQSEHVGVVKKWGRKWVQIVNDNRAGRKDGGLDWIIAARGVIVAAEEKAA